MAKNGKLPKRIAGVKIPKTLRTRGGKLYGLVNNPLIADLLAVALLTAADRIIKQPKVKKAGKAAKHAAEGTADAAGENVVDFASILAMAAREGARALKSR